MTGRQLRLGKPSRAPSPGAIHLVVPRNKQTSQLADKSRALRHETSPLPRRPDSSVLSDSIPLFFIGQNRHGLWVAREASEQAGGLFLLRRSALRFAQKNSHPAGCATMLLAEPLELDVANQGGFFATRLAAAIEAAVRGTPTAGAIVEMVIVKWRRLVNQISRALAAPRGREAIER
jgi:hypothetical protein